MSLKRTLTSVAVDSARDYLMERFNEIKQLDLDHDGHKDVDQIMELLTRLSEKLKDAVEATDFQRLAAGLEQVIAGAGMIGESVNREKLGEASVELASTVRQLGKLAKLAIQEVKQHEKLG